CPSARRARLTVAVLLRVRSLGALAALLLGHSRERFLDVLTAAGPRDFPAPLTRDRVTHPLLLTFRLQQTQQARNGIRRCSPVTFYSVINLPSGTPRILPNLRPLVGVRSPA